MIRLASGALAAALAVSPAAALVGPSDPAPDLAPHVVMLLNRTGRTAGFCSAVVVAPDALLTAAHCAPPGAALRAFENNGGTPAMHEIREAERSPDYRADAIRSRQRSVDLALVRLAAPLPPRFTPATLGAMPPHAPGSPFRLAGFGLRQEGAPASSGTLRAATVTARAPVSEVLLWAGGGACTGDSGGPVLEGGAVVAVIAWAAGSGDRQCGALTQAVWVAPQRSWIDGVLQRWSGR